MEQSLPPIPAPPLGPPPPSPPLPSVVGNVAGGGCQVRCAGCRTILTVGSGLTEFLCPTCRLPQMLPPELLPTQHAVAHGIDPTKIQLPCAFCKAILNVPHGLTRFNCPQCKTELGVDLSKNNQSIPPPPWPLPPPEEVNEV